MIVNMEVRFIEMGNRGRVEYDFETETYSWEYKGDKERFRDLLEMLKDGRVYDEMVTGTPPDDVDDDEPYRPSESYELVSWDEQLRRLARDPRRNGAQVNVIEG